MVGRNYFKRQAATLVKYAQSTSDPQTVAALIEKADQLNSQGDETPIPSPDLSPRPPDIEPEAALRVAFAPLPYFCFPNIARTRPVASTHNSPRLRVRIGWRLTPIARAS
jgi:hypothetical protein